MKSNRMLGMSLAAILATAVGAQADTLNYGAGFPASAKIFSEGVLPVLNSMSEQSAHGLAFNILAGGQVVGMGDEVDALADGLVDSAYLLIQFTPNDLPAASLITELLAFSTDPMAASGAFAELIMVSCEECKKDFEKHDIIPIDSAAATPYVLMCSKEISDPAEVAGLRTRMANPATGRWAERLGMSASVIPGPEVSQAMQFGRIDCAISLVSWLQHFGLFDSVKTIIDFPQGAATGAIGLGISRRAWDKMQPSDRQLILDTAPDLHASHVVNGYVLPDQPIMQAALDKGINVLDGGAYFDDAWSAFKESEVEQIIEVARRRGLQNPEQTVQIMIDTYERWHTTLKDEFGDDIGKYRDVLAREVYSKVSVD